MDLSNFEVTGRRTTSPLGAMYDRMDTGAEVVLKHPVRIREIGLRRDNL